MVLPTFLPRGKEGLFCNEVRPALELLHVQLICTDLINSFSQFHTVNTIPTAVLCTLTWEWAPLRPVGMDFHLHKYAQVCAVRYLYMACCPKQSSFGWHRKVPFGAFECMQLAPVLLAASSPPSPTTQPYGNWFWRTRGSSRVLWTAVWGTTKIETCITCLHASNLSDPLVTIHWVVLSVNHWCKLYVTSLLFWKMDSRWQQINSNGKRDNLIFEALQSKMDSMPPKLTKVQTIRMNFQYVCLVVHTSINE